MAMRQYVLKRHGYLAGKIVRGKSGDIALKITYLSLQALDLGLTLLAARLGFAELNPWMRAALASPGQLAVFKCALPLLISWFVPGKWLLPAIALLGGVVGWNVKELLVWLF